MSTMITDCLTSQEMRKDFDYVICDSPAGIESGARHAMVREGRKRQGGR
jgi:septum formation inhibitor-activating ATPase MinD